MRKILFSILVVFLVLYGTNVMAQFQGSGVKIGFGLGVQTGQTDFEKAIDDHEICGHGRFFMRFPFSDSWQLDFGTGIGRIRGENYTTVLHPTDFRLLFSPFESDYWNTYLYTGVGLLQYQVTELKVPGKKAAGYAGFLPLGLGLQFALGDQTALEFSGGFNYAFSDRLESHVADMKDAFWSVTAGLTFSTENPDGDPDRDGLTNHIENEIGTFPKFPDSDGDNLNDGAEFNIHKTDPMNEDSDADSLNDGLEVSTLKTNPLNADSDADGLTDFAEVEAYKTNPLKADTDNDGLTDADEIQKHKTSPLKPDTDADGLTDYAEISETGTNPLKADTDDDQIMDGKDKCPLKPETRNNYEDEDGCPDKKPEVVFEKKAPIVLTGVTFKTGSASLTDSAKETLAKVVRTLKDYSDISLEIQGHTDNVGRRSFNLKLSQKRANSVKDYLISQGIEADRLTAKGYGPDVPVASNATKAGRQQNRRISFVRMD